MTEKERIEYHLKIVINFLRETMEDEFSKLSKNQREKYLDALDEIESENNKEDIIHYILNTQ